MFVIMATMSLAYDYHMEDYVYGKHLELVEFDDASTFFLVDSLLYEDMLTSNTNKFKGTFSYAFDDEDDYYSVENFLFFGEAKFNDRSKLHYKITDYQLIDTYIDEYGTSAYADAYLEYEVQVTLTRRLPVEVITEFYEDEDYWQNQIFIDGDDIHIVFENDMDEGRGRFQRKVSELK